MLCFIRHTDGATDAFLWSRKCGCRTVFTSVHPRGEGGEAETAVSPTYETHPQGVHTSRLIPEFHAESLDNTELPQETFVDKLKRRYVVETVCREGIGC